MSVDKDMCGYNFSDSGLDPEESFDCATCGRNFTSIDALGDHVCFKEEYQC
jgi:hypothetical protein